MTRAKSAGSLPSARGAPARALLRQSNELLPPHALAPACQRGAVEHQPVLEELFAAEILVIRVLDPMLAQRLVGEVLHVLEDGKPSHQTRRQRRMTRLVRVDRAKLLFQEAPVDRSRQPHQRVLQIDDLIQTRAEQILLAGLPSLLWLHCANPLRPTLVESTESQLQIRGNRQTEFAGKPGAKPHKLANSITSSRSINQSAQWLRNSSRPTTTRSNRASRIRVQSAWAVTKKCESPD